MKIILVFILFIIAIMVGESKAADVGFYVGQSKTEIFETARFAFPDLAQTDGRAGCCKMSVFEDKSATALKVDVRERFDNFALTGSIAYLGTYHVGFDVGGNFSAPQPGRCVESGAFSLYSAAVELSYPYKMGKFEIEPRIGMAANEAIYHTISQCDFTTFSDHVDRKDNRFSMNPIYGVSLAYDGFTLGVDARRITLSNNPESQSYGMGRMNVVTVWAGYRW